VEPRVPDGLAPGNSHGRYPGILLEKDVSIDP
jgi:hypothetical protein